MFGSLKRIGILRKYQIYLEILQPLCAFSLVVPYHCLVSLMAHYLVAWSWAPSVYDFS